MVWLLVILHVFIGSVLAGTVVIVVLVMGFQTLAPFVIAAIAGFIAAFPVSWIVAKRLYTSG